LEFDNFYVASRTIRYTVTYVSENRIVDVDCSELFSSCDNINETADEELDKACRERYPYWFDYCEKKESASETTESNDVFMFDLTDETELEVKDLFELDASATITVTSTNETESKEECELCERIATRTCDAEYALCASDSPSEGPSSSPTRAPTAPSPVSSLFNLIGRLFSGVTEWFRRLFKFSF